MCDFVSWIGRGNDPPLYLTDAHLRSKTCREMGKEGTWFGDMAGHGVIKRYYNMSFVAYPFHKECTSVVYPKKFPVEIRRDLALCKLSLLMDYHKGVMMLAPPVRPEFKKFITKTEKELGATRRKIYTRVGFAMEGYLVRAFKVYQAELKKQKILSVEFKRLFADPENQARQWRPIVVAAQAGEMG